MHVFANPARFLSIARPLTPWLCSLGIALVAIGLGSGLFVAPPDYLQGESVRIMYVHVPAAWLGMAGWAGIAGAGLALLVWRHPLAGIAARAIAVPGLVFTAVCLATGSLWGRPSWGTYWEWDGRMTSMLVLLFLYIAFVVLADADADRGGDGRVPAVFGLVGAINLPVIHYSVLWWRTLHQGQSISLTRSTIDPSMLWPLLVAALGFLLLFAAVTLMRMRTILARNRIEARMRRL